MGLYYDGTSDATWTYPMCRHLKELEDEVSRLRAENDEWEKHSLVQIVAERDMLRATIDRLQCERNEVQDRVATCECQNARLREQLQASVELTAIREEQLQDEIHGTNINFSSWLSEEMQDLEYCVQGAPGASRDLNNVCC